MSRSQMSKPNLAISDHNSSLNPHKAWSSKVEVPYCFPWSFVKFQGLTWQKKNPDADPDWGFLDCHSSLNSPMAFKCCTNVRYHRRGTLMFFRSHSSNVKIIRAKNPWFKSNLSEIMKPVTAIKSFGFALLFNFFEKNVFNGSIKDRPALIMAWRPTGDKSLLGPMMPS